MAGREGEGDGGEVPEAREETLEDYREEINEKYDEGGEKDVSNSGEKDQTDESDRQGDSDGAGSAEAASAGGDVSKGQIEQMPESRHESNEENPGSEVAKPEGRESPGKTMADDLESMREHLNEKYPEDGREIADGNGAPPTWQKDSGEGIEVDSSAEKTGESGKELASETKTENPTDGAETSARNPSALAGNVSGAANEDVGWKNIDELREHQNEGDSLNSRNPINQEESRRPEARGSEAAKSSGERLSPAGQEELEPRGEAKGGGNHHPEHDRPMSEKDGSQDVHKGRSQEDEEGGDQPPIVRKASKYMASLALIIPDQAIPKHESGDDVYEVGISRVSKPGEQYKVYMTHNPVNDRAYLPIKQVDAERGEEFYVRRPRRYEEEDFARDYNASKPKGLENTSLEWRDDKFMLKIGGAEFALREPKLRAQEGKAVLDVKLNDEGKNAVKIAKGIDGAEFRFKSDHAVVTSMKEREEGLAVTYQRTQHDKFPHARLANVEKVQHAAVEKPKSWEHRVEFNSEGMRLEKPIGKSTDSIRIEFSEPIARKAWEYWSSATSKSERFYHQGDIGESVARMALEQSGFKTFPKEIFEPANTRSYVHESEMRGPDVVVYGIAGTKEGYHICQVKHWREPAKALKEGREDAIKFRESREDRPLLEQKLGNKILGSFVIELDWSYKDLVGIIYSEYMEY